MTQPDFEIETSLRARRLKARLPPDKRDGAESENVELSRDESRQNVPSELRASEVYKDVRIRQKLTGRVKP